jgi:hypothetical protein
MFTLAVLLLGIKVINLHFEFSKYLPEAVAAILNGALKFLPKPLEFQDSFGPLRVDAILGPDTTVSPADGSKAATPVISGTVEQTPVHPDVTGVEHNADSQTIPASVLEPGPVDGMPGTVNADGPDVA